MAEASTTARALLEQGLARYGRGEVDEALQAWRQALQVEPGNAEAQKLVRFVEERKASGAVDARRTTRAMPVQREKTEMGMNPLLMAGDLGNADDENARPTSEALPTMSAGGKDGQEGGQEGGNDHAAEPAGKRKRRNTLVSALPAILAPSTRLSGERITPTKAMQVPASARPTPVPPKPAAPKPAPPPGSKDTVRPVDTDQSSASGEYEDIESSDLDELIVDADLDKTDPDGDFGSTTPPPLDSVPVQRTSNENTRPIGDDGSGPHTPEPELLHRSDTPIDIALAMSRQRAAQLVDECRAAMDKGNLPAAAVAADEALEEGERAPMPGIAEVIEPARSMFEQAFAGHLGPEDGVPEMSADSSSVNTSNFDHRTGFLLSCIDGTLPIQTLMDISGMARADCLRTLSRLLSQGIIKLG